MSSMVQIHVLIRPIAMTSQKFFEVKIQGCKCTLHLPAGTHACGQKIWNRRILVYCARLVNCHVACQLGEATKTRVQLGIQKSDRRHEAAEMT